MKKPAKRKQTPRPGVEPGDEVFFHHDGQPSHGRVLCHGAHGCTIDHGGQQRRVYWSDVLGHKARANKQFEVLDRGDDGAIVRDQSGRTRFVAGDVPEPDTRPDETADDVSVVRQAVEKCAPLKKSLSAGRVVLFCRR